MTVEITLSQIGGQEIAFADLVEKHVQRLHAFNKTIGQPRPTASPLVEMAIRRIQENGKSDTYIADYKIIDDTPPPPPPLNLEDRKIQLHNRLLIAENDAKDKVMPPRKKRLMSLQYDKAIANSNRTAEEQASLDAFLEVNRRWLEIGEIAAKAESEIEDLTEDTIGAWQLPDFG